MNFWHVILIITVVTGLLGFWRTPFWNGILLYCDHKDGNDIDWGVEMFSMLVGPFAYLYAIFAIILIFMP